MIPSYTSKARRVGEATVFLIPALVFFVAFVIIPIILCLSYSLFDWNGAGAKTFIGFANIKKLFSDEMVWKSLSNIFKLTFWALVIQIPMGLIFAALLSRPYRFTKTFKTIYFMPVILSSAVLGILWGQIYDPNVGLLNGILGGIGLGNLKQVWLGDPNLALGAVITVVAWQYIGFYIVIFYAALCNVPEDIVEAARIEGAGEFRTLFRIKLPLIWSVVQFAVINCVINSLRYFDLIYIMTDGGPFNASEVLASYLVKQAFRFFDFGYASAVAALLLVVGLVFAFVLNRFMRRETVQY